MHLARRGIETRTFVGPIRPQGFAGRGVCRDNVSPGTGSEIEHAVDHQRRRLGGDRFSSCSVVVETPRPGDLQVLYVVPVDLIQRRIASSAVVAAVGAPLSHGAGGGRCLGGRIVLATADKWQCRKKGENAEDEMRTTRCRHWKTPFVRDAGVECGVILDPKGPRPKA